MKATPVPLHKILGSYTLSQNSYAPGQGLQKNLKITTRAVARTLIGGGGGCIFIYSGSA